MKGIDNGGKNRVRKYFIDEVAQEKECGLCNEIKSFTEFYINQFGRPRSYCKDCMKKQNKKGEKKC